MKKPAFNNRLIEESSPYLLQHAHNPVDWHPWNDTSLDKAMQEDKLILISVGYSACHWCHVMEHESFEDEEVAAIMNEHYLPIKVDREERPDVDQVYMNAIQAMTGMGGWPMNVVALPDGRPVWGGTYFKKEQWINALEQIAGLYTRQPEKLLEYAGKLEEGLSQLQIIDVPEDEKELDASLFQGIIAKWKQDFDYENGGYNRSPKFMMPSNYDFLLRYSIQQKDKGLLTYVQHTFNKISWGGVYDPIDGGFARYSVDEKWHVPHFEKMLYDNAQLISSYAALYKESKNEWYANVVKKTIDFVENELRGDSGAFYSALDADSDNKEGHLEEGAYYVWTLTELKNILKEDYHLFEKVYRLDVFGRWEKDHYVLIRTKSLDTISKELGMDRNGLENTLKILHKKLKKAKSLRVKPGLDDKSITSWNAMMISAYCHAYQALQQEAYLEKAISSMNFLNSSFKQENGRLYRIYKNGKSMINAYLEDYAFVIQALLDLYESCFDEHYLQRAEELIAIVEADFRNDKTGLYFFTSSKDRALINRVVEIQDNVIPAANSVMAHNYFRLGKITGNTALVDTAKHMLQVVLAGMDHYAPSYSNWLQLLLNFTYPFYEIVITGKDAAELAKQFQQRYMPNKVIAATATPSNLPILKDRLRQDKSFIYICKYGQCHLPVLTVSEALEQMT